MELEDGSVLSLLVTRSISSRVEGTVGSTLNGGGHVTFDLRRWA